MTYWGPEQAARVRETADYLTVVRTLVGIRSGSEDRPVGMCPFHGDRVGTLELMPEDGTHHCTQCGAQGDLFALAQGVRNLTYQQAVELVAKESGLDLVDLAAERPDPDLVHAVRDACELATAHFEMTLWLPAGAAALAYLRGRGIADDQIRQFRLGWADGTFLATALRAGRSAEVLREADLAHVHDDELRDRFWSRITVPILDSLGRVIAFSARLLPEEAQRRKDRNLPVSKYVNSTKTPTYDKGSSLYNLRKARSAARKAKRLMLVEGPLDVIACAQAGMPEVVACLGTSFTAEQARLLVEGGHGSVPVVVCLDGDAAGRAKRAVAVRHLLSVGASVQVADLPDGDPAELLSATSEKVDVVGFKAAVTKVRPGAAWYLEHLAPTPDALDDGQRLSLLDEVMALVSGVTDAAYRSLVIKRAAKYLQIDQVTAKAKAKNRAASEEIAVAEKRVALTDYGNARRFLAKCAERVRYCRDWSSWVVWTGHRWEVDDINDTLTWGLYHAAMDQHLNEEVAIAQRLGLNDHVRRLRNWRENSDSTASHKSALEQACRLAEVQARSREFDRDPYLFACSNGTLDLRTGELLEHTREHMITRMADADWLGDQVVDDKWAGFVAHIAGDPEIAAYLKRFAGYSATAITTEKAIVILQGDGDSGKTTYVNALQALFGSYSGSLNAENFLAQQQPQKKWELANCDTARFVTIEEVGTEGRGFAIDFLKSATGGNQITGERKYGQPYSFRPVWKLLFVCNDTPSAPAGDNATWNRINLIHAAPPPKVLDKTLGAHFQSPAGRSAILAWVVAGARDYLKRGSLAAPDSIRLATAQHRHDCDYLTQYLDEAWVPGEPETDIVSVGTFLADFHAWCRLNRHYELSAKAVIKRLAPLGIKADQWVYDDEKRRSVRGWAGLRQRTGDGPTWSMINHSPHIRHASATGGETDAALATDSTQLRLLASFDDGSQASSIATDARPIITSGQTTPPNDATHASVATIRGESVANVSHYKTESPADFATHATDLPRVARTHEGSETISDQSFQGEVQQPPSNRGVPPIDLARLPPSTPPPPAPRGDRLRRPPDDNENHFDPPQDPPQDTTP